MAKKTITRALRATVLTALLTTAPVSNAADQQNDSLGAAINVLLGAYNGAVNAAAENQGTTAQTINRSDLQPLENTLKRYQKELQGIVNSDGEINTQRLGELLNRLQTDNSGKINYDFVQALNAFKGLSSESGPQSFLDQRILSQLVGAAKDQELNRELSQAAPYVATILQLGSLISQDSQRADSQALSAEIRSLKALAERYQAQPGLAQDVKVASAQLKVLYAEQVLGEPVDQRAIDTAKQELDTLQRRVVAAAPQSLPAGAYDELLRPLAALGKPFAQQLDQWQALRAISRQQQTHLPVSNSSGFDAPTRKLLDALDYDNLPPHVQRELLERLNIYSPN